MGPVGLKIGVEARPASRIAVSIEVPPDRSQAGYDEALSRLSRSVTLPGFRKGKVPRAVLIQQIGLVRIRATALETLADGVWKEALEQESLKPLSEPELVGGFESLLEAFEPGQPFTFTFETDVEPTPNLKKKTGFEVTTQLVSFDASKVDELLQESRKQMATIIPVLDRKAQKGDIAVVSFKGIYGDDGKSIKGGDADSMDIDLETDRMIPGFVEGILGMNLNEKRNIKCKFPDDYSDEQARGREAEFTLTLNDLKTRELPPLDDEFARQASDKSSLKELRDELEERLKKDAKRKNDNNRKSALLDALVKEVEVELPESLIQNEIRNLIEQTASNFAQQGMDVKSMFTPDLVKSLMESSRPEAENNLRANFALKALALSEDIKVDDQEVETKIKELSNELSDQKNIDIQRLRIVVREDLLKDKLINWLGDNSTIIENKESDSSDSAKAKIKPKGAKVKSSSSSTSKENKKASSGRGDSGSS